MVHLILQQFEWNKLGASHYVCEHGLRQGFLLR